MFECFDAFASLLEKGFVFGFICLVVFVLLGVAESVVDKVRDRRNPRE